MEEKRVNISEEKPPRVRAVTSRDLKLSRRSRPRTKPPSPPPATGNVAQVIEMGFPRGAVEQAAKALDRGTDVGPSPESIVGWLLEHPDQITAEPEHVYQSTLSEPCSDTDSFSDSFEDIDASASTSELGNLTNHRAVSYIIC